MKKIIIFLFIIATLFLNNTFAQNSLDESIKEIEQSYNNNILNLQNKLEIAKIGLKNQESIAARQANISAAQAGSSGLQLSESATQDIKDDIKSKYSSNINYYKNLISELENNITSLKNEKQQKINDAKKNYKNNTSYTNTNNTETIKSNSSTECLFAREKLSNLYKESINNIKNKNKLEEINTEYKKYLDIAEGISGCLVTYTYKEGYYYNKGLIEEYNGNNKKAIEYFNKTLDYTKKICKNACQNDNTYKDLLNRISYLSKTNNELCTEKYGNNTYGDDKYCYCNNGYTWNKDNTYCIKKEIKTDLSEKTKTYLNNYFENIKQKVDNQPIGTKQNFYNTINDKLSLIISKQKSKKNIDILNYLKFLTENELSKVDSEDFNLEDILK